MRYILFLLLLAACQSKPTEPGEVKGEGEAVFITMTGKELSMRYYALNSDDYTAVSVASRYNSFNYRLQFDSDSTLLMKSDKYITPRSYRIEGDSFYLDSKAFFIEAHGQTVYLRDSLFLIELR